MIKYTQYKEITCDICGKKTKFDAVYDFPYSYGFRKVDLRETTAINTTYEVCESCYKKIEKFIATLGEDTKWMQ